MHIGLGDAGSESTSLISTNPGAEPEDRPPSESAPSHPRYSTTTVGCVWLIPDSPRQGKQRGPGIRCPALTIVQVGVMVSEIGSGFGNLLFDQDGTEQQVRVACLHTYSSMRLPLRWP